MASSTSGQPTRLLELQLLHQWATVTYKSYCALRAGTVDAEYYNWQIHFPQLALKHDCLLDGMFAMSALEIGAFSEGGVNQEYVDVALEYQNRASSKLREQLTNSDLVSISQEQHQALWALSSMLMVLALAVPPFVTEAGERYNMLEHMMTFLDLMKGFVVIVASKIKDIKDDPLFSNYKEWHELDDQPIPPETQTALDRLKDLNEECYGASHKRIDVPEIKAMAYHASNRQAIFWLQDGAAKCSLPETRAYGLAFLLQAGKEYVSALKEREPVALLILMHWGAFLEQQSYGVWYVERVGKCLIEDLSDDPRLHENPKMLEGINWVRKQVGLE